MAEAGTREVSLLFSGGVDSTTAALLLAERYDRVHLLTYCNGYGHYRIERTRKRVEELRRHCGDRFVHVVGSVRPLFERMLPDPLAEYRRHRSGFIWCLGCKMAMHTQAILYDLEHGITEAADGSSQSTGEMVEQMLLSVCLIREMYEEHGIAYRTPVYTFPREREVGELRRRGFRMGVRIGSRFLGIQPKCKPGELYYLPFLLLNQPPAHDEDRVAAFLREKREVARAVIEEWRAGRGGAAAGAVEAGRDGLL